MTQPTDYPRTTAFSQGISFFDPRNPATKRALLPLQQNVSAPRSSTLSTDTGLLVPNILVGDRLAHFPDDLYDLSDNSHLSRFLKALLGDAGAGQLRNRYTIAQFQTTAPNFFDLDRFYGAIFGASRVTSEAVEVNGFTGVATNEEWDQILTADTIYRERLFHLARGINMGATVPGVTAIAEAITGVDCEVYEVWRLLDAADPTYGVPIVPIPPGPDRNAHRTWGGVEITYFTWQDIDSFVWDDIEHGGAIPPDRPLVLGMAEDVIYGTGTSRTWLDVYNSWASYGAMETKPDHTAQKWQDIETAPLTAGPLLTATVNDSIVVLDWSTYGGAIGYEIQQDGSMIGRVPTGTLEFITPTLAAAHYVFRVVPYTAYNSGTNTYTYGTASNSVTVEVLPGPAELVGDERSRSFFIIRPKKQYDSEEDQAEERYVLGRVLDRIRPAGARFRVDENGLDLVQQVPFGNLASPSNFWEIITKVTPRKGLTANPNHLYPLSKKQKKSGVLATDTHEVPRPAFAAAQTDEWSYNSEVVQTIAYAMGSDGTVLESAAAETVNYLDGNSVTYGPDRALVDARQRLAARYAGDGVMVAAPYSDDRVTVGTHG